MHSGDSSCTSVPKAKLRKYQAIFDVKKSGKSQVWGHGLFWGSVLFNMRSPKGGCCSISDDLSCSFNDMYLAYVSHKKRRNQLFGKINLPTWKNSVTNYVIHMCPRSTKVLSENYCHFLIFFNNTDFKNMLIGLKAILAEKLIWPSQ